jgi:hypothetical protein
LAPIFLSVILTILWQKLWKRKYRKIVEFLF